MPQKSWVGLEDWLVGVSLIISLNPNPKNVEIGPLMPESVKEQKRRKIMDYILIRNPRIAGMLMTIGHKPFVAIDGGRPVYKFKTADRVRADITKITTSGANFSDSRISLNIKPRPQATKPL